MTHSSKNIVLAMAGASGTAYAIRLGQVLLRHDLHVHLVVSEAARMVSVQEMEMPLPKATATAQDWVDYWQTSFEDGRAADWGFRKIEGDVKADVSVYGLKDFSARIASGSSLTRGMVICPCSMGTLASIANGLSTNLIQRAADVHMKERRPLVLVPRETPLSTIALENMTKLSQAGATVMPAMPGYYHQPTCVADMVDFVVARICDHLHIEHSLMSRWGE